MTLFHDIQIYSNDVFFFFFFTPSWIRDEKAVIFAFKFLKTLPWFKRFERPVQTDLIAIIMCTVVVGTWSIHKPIQMWAFFWHNDGVVDSSLES